jgi:putative ubiquitin-RnfH superfamily antitoxin RatB of RatAB toxin-antitoxin module
MRIENIMQQQNSRKALYQERETLVKKLHMVESDLKTLENNIGFFSKSKNSEALLKDFKDKIEIGKKEVEVIKEQVRFIDNIYKN